MGKWCFHFLWLFTYLKTIQNILMTIHAGFQVSDQCPLGYLFLISETQPGAALLESTIIGIFVRMEKISASLCPVRLFSFKFVLIVHIRPAFYGNVNTNASESYKRLTTTTNALPTIRMACD